MANKDSIPWSDIYLLGWYDRSKRPYLTTWEGDRPLIHVVVLGIANGQIPVWNAAVPRGATVVRIPDGDNPHEQAAKLNGIYAFGWHMPGDVARGGPSSAVIQRITRHLDTSEEGFVDADTA